MNNKWLKLGLIFVPTQQQKWLHTHSWVPTALRLGKNKYRIYFSARDENNLSETGYFDFDLKTKLVSNLSDQPILKRGSLGLFDDSLAVGCSVVQHADRLYMYYVGWQQTNRTRYLPSIGLSISKDGGSNFEKYSIAPLIPRSQEEPYGMASPFVLKVEKQWFMWFASYREWTLRKGDPWPRYEIRVALSDDGISWTHLTNSCIGSDQEEAVARPWVLHNGKKFQMWYSFRKNYKTYRIGYAESLDGVNWTRHDDRAGIDISEDGFDSEMLEYPCVIVEENKEFMFYNGNEFGKHGIGLAVRSVI